MTKAMSSVNHNTAGLIDLHAHILPEFDDGPETPEESLKMARAYVKAGYATVVATPHVIPGLYEHSRTAIIEAVSELQRRLDAAGIPLAVLPGAEYHLTDKLVSMNKAGELVTLNDTGKYLLVELPFHDIPAYTNQVFFELLLAGITPIIAHPERNEFLIRQRGVLAQTVQSGILAQVTAGSLIGLFGSMAKRTANHLINEDIAQFVATDAHGSGRRLEAGPTAVQLLGLKGLTLMREHPLAVVNGTDLEIAVSMEIAPARTGWLASIFGKRK